MKIYTKTGDDGETGLLGGVRVSKNHTCIEVCGTLDELNSMLGWARSEIQVAEVDQVLARIQNDLFDLGARVAASLGKQDNRIAEITQGHIQYLESSIDKLQSGLPELKQFILPGGSAVASQLHLARAICRRAERSLVGLRTLETNCDLTNELVYLNRLGDLLFVAARYVNVLSGQTETPWSPRA